MRLIDAKTLLDSACDRCSREACELISKGKENNCFIKNIIDNAPTVEERKQGRWLDHPNKELKEWMVCSSCGVGCKLIEHLDDSIEIQMYVFCPHCGADMRGE